MIATTRTISLHGQLLGGREPFFLIAGPCVIESAAHCLDIAARLKEITTALEVPLIFKASFDKANRTAVTSYRGPGLERGLEILAAVREEYGVPVLSDIHEVWQAERAAEVLDVQAPRRLPFAPEDRSGEELLATRFMIAPALPW